MTHIQFQAHLQPQAPAPLQAFLVLHVTSLIDAYLGAPLHYTVIGLLRAERVEHTFQALQQHERDWTRQPGNVRLVSEFTPVRSASVHDLLITPTGEIWRIDGFGYSQLPALPGQVTFSDTARQILNAEHGPDGHRDRRT